MSKAKTPEPTLETPDEPTPIPAPAPAPRESLVAVWDWAHTRAATHGIELMGAFVRGYGKASDRPSALDAALTVFLNKEVS